MSKKIKTDSPEFKALEQEWYQKLKDDGFEDIEDTTRADKPLKSWHSLRFKNKPIMDNTTYYEDAKELLRTYQFKTNTHRYIWSLHCEGLTLRQIESSLANQKAYKSLKRQMICNIVKEIAKTIKKEDHE